MKKNLLKKTVAMSLIMTMMTPAVTFADGKVELGFKNDISKYLWSNIKVLEIFKNWCEQNGEIQMPKPDLDNFIPQKPNMDQNLPQIPNLDNNHQKPEIDNETNDDIETENEDNTQNMGKYDLEVLQFVNQERLKEGLPTLTYNAKLANLADVKAADMRDNNYFSHTSPKYGSPFDMMKQFGIRYSFAGENIAKGQKTPESVMDAWMNSSGHRANILSDNYEQLGVGYETDKSGNTYWVQMFIK